MMRNERAVFYAGLSTCFIVLVLLALFTNGTGEGGDSFYHYLFARYAWDYPQLFFDHWAKPLFTIIASPFAQLGFKGVKVFNVIVSVLACFFTYQTARQLGIKNAFLLVFFYFSATLNVTVTLSALTEPLFALVFILSVYLFVVKKPLPAVMLVSFLPFVRSEGLVMLCIFAVYLLVKRQYKYLPVLLFGHLVMSVLGAFYYKDLLWVFNRIPYAKLNSNYGSGTWDHFVVQLNFMIGPVLYLLLVAGGISQLFKIRKEFAQPLFNEKLFLVYGGFIGFFAAHTAFWALGIFNSLGLSRVFVGVMPLIMLIALEGFNLLTGLIRAERVKNIVSTVLLFAVILFPFVNNPAAYDLKNDFSYNENQRMLQDKLIPYLQQRYPGYKLYASTVDLPFLMNVDVFNNNVYGELKHLGPGMTLKAHEVAVWDSWVSVVEEHVSREQLEASLHADTTFYAATPKGDTVTYVVFVKK